MKNKVMAKTTYTPGVCNIGPGEIKMRKRIAWLALLAMFVLIAILFVTGAARFWRITVIIPAYAAALGFLQTSRQFCVYYGMRGLENTADKTPREINNPMDRAEAANIMVQSFFLAGMVLMIVLIVT